MNRKEFIKNAALTGFALSQQPAGLSRFSPDNVNLSPLVPYENNLRDRLWMWGHDSGVYDGAYGPYNIPLSIPIGMADAIKSMGIPNVCVIRRGIPFNGYINQFKSVKRIAWAMAMGSNESYQTLKNYVFGLRDTMPNLTGYFLDDFFRFSGAQSGDNSMKGAAPAALSMEELEQLYQETLAYKRRLDLSVVLYTHQLRPSIQPAMKYVDIVSLWIWNGNDIQKIEENFKKYRSLVPDKPTLLGIYMWDFGGKKELDQDFMIKQLNYAHRLYKEGKIEGMIFHCTPLVNKNLKAVNYARDWIAKYGDESR
jgi:hypothetical protein